MAWKPILLVLPSNRIVNFKEDEFTIGRNANSSLDIPSPFVSRNQCAIRKKDEDKWIIYDLSSFRTTSVNGQSIKDGGCVLADGDTISIVNCKDQEFKFYNDINSFQRTNKKRRLSEIVDASVLTSSSQDFKHGKENLLEKCNKLEKEKGVLSDKVRYLTALSENSQKSLGLLETENKVLRERLKEVENSKELLLFKVRDLEESLIDSKNKMQAIQIDNSKNKVQTVDKSTEPIPFEEMEVCNDIDFNEDIIEGDYFSNYNYERLSSEHSPYEPIDQHNLSIEAEDYKPLHVSDDKSELKKQVDQVESDFLEAENAALVSELEKKNQQVVAAINEKEKFRTYILEALEHELLCSICNEILYESVTLNCKHTFCKICVVEWKKKKKDCPVCRTKIKFEAFNLILDSFIDKAAEILGEEFKTRRDEVKMERKDPGKISPRWKRGKGKGRGRGNRNLMNYITHHIAIETVELATLNNRGPRAVVELVDLT